MIRCGPINKLGTIWWFEFFDLAEERKEEVLSKLLSIMGKFEGSYSRFRPDSVVSLLNESKILEDPSEEFLSLLTLAQRAWQETQGVFNIAVGSYLEKTGYDRDYSFQACTLPQIQGLDKVLAFSGEQVSLDPSAKIDLGGLGKGYLIDTLARVLQEEYGLKYFLINGGGDMYATSEHGQALTIALQDPRDQTLHGTINLSHQGFASSSPYLRSWTDQRGEEHNHLVGEGAKNIVYLTAPTATQADIWATALAIDSSLHPPQDVQVLII